LNADPHFGRLCTFALRSVCRPRRDLWGRRRLLQHPESWRFRPIGQPPQWGL